MWTDHEKDTETPAVTWEKGALNLQKVCNSYSQVEYILSFTTGNFDLFIKQLKSDSCNSYESYLESDFNGYSHGWMARISYPFILPSHHLFYKRRVSFSSIRYVWMNDMKWRFLVQFSCSVVSNSLRPHGLQHTRLPSPSPTPGAYSDSCPSCWKMPSNHLILCRPLLLLPTIFPSLRVFFSQSVPCIRWPKYWSFSFSGGFKSQ